MGNQSLKVYEAVLKPQASLFAENQKLSRFYNYVYGLTIAKKTFNTHKVIHILYWIPQVEKELPASDIESGQFLAPEAGD